MTIAHDAHPPTEEQDDTVEAHYASLDLCRYVAASPGPREVKEGRAQGQGSRPW
jgi:hypothetical protein